MLHAAADDLAHAAALVRHVAASIGSMPSPSSPVSANAPASESPSAREGTSQRGEQDGGDQPARPSGKLKARPFTPSLITGVSPDLGPGIPDPFLLAKRLGPDGLRTALAELRRGTLRAIIREHGIAAAAQVARISDDAKLRQMILDAVARKT